MLNNDELAQQAISAALKQDWDSAIDFNLRILRTETTNIPALNRLGRAYAETGQPKSAKKSFNKVLDLDKHNSVAINSLSRLKLGGKSSAAMVNFSFIEEPGKTKTVALYKLAPLTVLGQLTNSQPVIFKVNKRNICVQSAKKNFIGYLPDDLSMHLIRLLKLGNKYEAAIKTVAKNKVEIFIRETKRAAKLRGVPSFSTKDTSRYYQFLPTEPIAETPLEIETTEEDDHQL